jgi:hypothetical protein
VSGGKLVDRVFTPFGFREVWVSGRDVMLNGRKLWMAGTYHSKHSPLRDLNDCHALLPAIRMCRDYTPRRESRCLKGTLEHTNESGTKQTRGLRSGSDHP